jgi:hypothetical protein
VANVPEIMVTIGPTLEKPDDLRRAIDAGARWFRLPCGYRQRPHLANAQCVRGRLGSERTQSMGLAAWGALCYGIPGTQYSIW